jgi:hypothetical protein
MYDAVFIAPVLSDVKALILLQAAHQPQSAEKINRYIFRYLAAYPLIVVCIGTMVALL